MLSITNTDNVDVNCTRNWLNDSHTLSNFVLLYFKTSVYSHIQVFFTLFPMVEEPQVDVEHQASAVLHNRPQDAEHS